MNNIFVVVGVMALVSSASAMQIMDDQDLASQTGQDGITIKTGVSAVSFDHVALIDTNGMTGATNSAALIIAPNTSGSSVKVNFLNGSGSAVNNLFTANIDSDAGNSGAFANFNLAFSELKTIKLDPFSVYLAPTLNGSRTIGSVGSVFGAGTSLRPGVSKLVQIGSGAEGLNINFKDTLGINLQLGNTPQNHMIKFSGSLQSVNIPKIKVFSNNTGNTTSSLNLDVSFTATDTSGFGLGKFYLDVAPGGLIFGADGTTSKFNAQIDNVVAGLSGAATASNDPKEQIFNNLKNGSMGNFGVVGATVSNLKMNVRGM